MTIWRRCYQLTTILPGLAVNGGSNWSLNSDGLGSVRWPMRPICRCFVIAFYFCRKRNVADGNVVEREKCESWWSRVTRVSQVDCLAGHTGHGSWVRDHYMWHVITWVRHHYKWPVVTLVTGHHNGLWVMGHGSLHVTRCQVGEGLSQMTSCHKWPVVTWVTGHHNGSWVMGHGSLQVTRCHVGHGYQKWPVANSIHRRLAAVGRCNR